MHLLDEKFLLDLLRKYGEEEQLLQTSGECGELIAVIQNYLRAIKYKHRSETLGDVLAEAVDVFFMVQQIRIMSPAMFDYLCIQKETKVRTKVLKGQLK